MRKITMENIETITTMELEAAYLDYINNYHTIEKYAEHNDIPVEFAQAIINAGRVVNQEILQALDEIPDPEYDDKSIQACNKNRNYYDRSTLVCAICKGPVDPEYADSFYNHEKKIQACNSVCLDKT